MVREKIYKNCSIHWFSKRQVGDVFFIVLRNKEDKGYMGKIGEIDVVHLFLSNCDNTHLDDQFFGDYWTESDLMDLSVAENLEPILAGKLYGRDFYFNPELMNGTPTDETQPTDFIEVFMDFKEIARLVNGTPYWDTERINFERIDGKNQFKYNT